MYFRRRIEFAVVAVLLLCTWYLFDAHFHAGQEKYVEKDTAEKPWRYEATEAEKQQRIPEQKNLIDGAMEETSTTSTVIRQTGTAIQETVIATPSPSLPDRVVVMAKLPIDDTLWVHSDL